MTPAEYADAVFEFANLRSGAGKHQQRLSEFLKRDQEYTVDVSLSDYMTSKNTKHKSSPNEPFLTLYELDPQRSEITRTADNGITFQTASEFEAYPQLSENDTQPQILFLRGYPSPEWLNTIGAKYKVDPEFYARHLDFLESHSSTTTHEFWLNPYLENTIQFNIPTIGSRDSDMRKYTQAEVEDLRRAADVSMRSYTENLTNGEGIAEGNAIVRKYFTFDQVHFVIEQRISIYIHRRSSSWICKNPVFQ